MPENTVSVHSQSSWGWQSKFSALPDRIAFLLERSILSDVEFILGTTADALTVPAHKFILASASKRFERLFYSPSPDFSDSKPITITHVTPSAFRSVLRYIYTDKTAQMVPNDVMDTLYAARYYELPVLIALCEQNAMSLCRANNVLTILNKAVQYGEDNIVEWCFPIIDQHFPVLTADADWLQISLDTLRRILSSDGLQVKELNVYNAMERWACHACERNGITASVANKREMLQTVFFLIRFPLMTTEELISCSAKTKVNII
ncbi:BTB/POZ domain-containing protein 2-like [Paramacrobiotus metropolitanus]|uniref:BTB/POZ domain-containing protein 2-like n=1 Tax=Paramacrobiotus metropolitanus TaxID=2943436 RepID=UPI002445C1BE|nr:BTB/POZ domain-containing protein 2-like [Paramacrobiotus metropolitanus]